MSEFRYQAVEENGARVAGVIEADDRQSALRLLGQRGLFPSNLEIKSANGAVASAAPKTKTDQPADFSFANRIKRKDITALTREISASSSSPLSAASVKTSGQMLMTPKIRA